VGRDVDPTAGLGDEDRKIGFTLKGIELKFLDPLALSYKELHKIKSEMIHETYCAS
jgi:hypothetical protein